MKNILAVIMFLFISLSANAYLTQEPDPIKKKVALVRMINKSLTETQAILLKDSLLKLSLKDLKEIHDKSKDYSEIVQSLEGRQPDDGDEHTSGSLNK